MDQELNQRMADGKSSGFPKVSIIIPAYNCASFISESLESVFNQNYHSYEIIIVNDGSTDDLETVLRPYNDRIRYVCQDNAGSASARNNGLNLARGEYIVFLDADDFLLPGKLRQQAAYLDLRPSLGIVHSGWRIIDKEGRILRDVEPWYDAPHLDLETWIRFKPVKMGAMMMRRKWVQSVGGLDPEQIQSHDVDLMLRLALAGCQTEWIYRPTLCYRQHRNSTMRKGAVDQAHYAVMAMQKFFNHPGLPDHLLKLKNRTLNYSSAWASWYLFSNGHLAETSQYLAISLEVSSQPPIKTAFDWVSLFAKWSNEVGLVVTDVKQMLPIFQEISHIPEDQIIPLIQFSSWWLENWQPDPEYSLAAKKSLDQLLLTLSNHELSHQVSYKLFLEWWFQVWQPYLTKHCLIGNEALRNFDSLDPKQIVEVEKMCILTEPDKVSASLIKQHWQDLLQSGILPKENETDITSLYLTYVGQVALRRHWKKTFQGIKPAIFLLRRKRGRECWRQFLSNGYKYYNLSNHNKTLVDSKEK